MKLANKIRNRFSFLFPVLALLICLTVPALAANDDGQNPQLVRQVQQELNDRGFDAGPVDGIMGPKTQAALKRFQAENGLPQNGQLGKETLEKLDIDRDQGDEGFLKKAAGAVGKAGTTAAKATAKGVKKGASATAQGAETAAEATATGATTAAKATATGATTAAKATAGAAKTTGKAVKKGSTEAADETKDFVAGEDEDGKIKERIEERFENEELIKRDLVDVKVKDGIVTLHFKEQRQGNERAFNQAVVLARGVDGVKNVFVRFPATR